MKKQVDRDVRQRRLLLVLGVLAVIMAAAITITSISILISIIREDRNQTVTGAANLAAKEIDADKIDSWLSDGKDDEYELQFDKLKHILENTPYLKYLYVYQIKEDGCHVVFDTDPEEAGQLAEVIPFDESFGPLIPSLLAGEPIDIIESNDSFGWLLTKYTPIYDSNGKCVAYAGADISMDEIRDYINRCIWPIVIISALFLGACLFIGFKMTVNKQKADELDMLREQQQRDKKLIREIIESFAKVIDMKDSYTQGHSTRVAKYTKMLAEELGYDQNTVEQYYNIALMHDIGKIGIPDQVLNKPGKLTDEEYAVIKSHTERGYEVLNSISLMPEIVVGAEFHHERPDGKGYPKGLKGEEIPRVAQIIAVADTFDAMYSNRPYRDRMNFEKAVDIIKNAAGTQLTKDVVEAFLRLAQKGVLRAPDDLGGGTFDDISNIHKKLDK